MDGNRAGNTCPERASIIVELRWLFKAADSAEIRPIKCARQCGEALTPRYTDFQHLFGRSELVCMIG